MPIFLGLRQIDITLYDRQFYYDQFPPIRFTVLWFVFPLVGWGASLAIHYYLRLRTAPLPIRRDEMTAENIAIEGLGASLA